MAYFRELKVEKRIDELHFPDITKLEPIDRNYDLLRRDERTPQKPQDVLLELRSKWYEDLGVQSLDDLFLSPPRDQHGYRRESKTLADKGQPRVLHALRTFTTDVDIIQYRLDVQADLITNDALVPALQQFYGEVVEAANMYFDAFARDHDRRLIYDQWGRVVYKKWENLPLAFAKIDKAINAFHAVLETTKSQGMQEVKAFLEQVQAHPTYQGWTQYAGQVYGGGRYFLAFDYDPVDGAKVAIQLGKVVPNSTIDDLLKGPVSQDGTMTHPDLPAHVVVKRVTGVVKSEFGHMMQEITGLNFSSLDNFCSVLVAGMEEQLSFYAALGSMYAKWDALGLPATRPIFGEGEGIEIRDTIHPVVAHTVKKATAQPTLNDYVIDAQNNGIVVSGPNDGGKTSSGKSFGLCIALAQAGIYVPARYMRMSKPVGEIYTHFILKEDVKDGKGRHKNELMRARKLCEVMTQNDFLLYDEPCGGTDVESGLIDSENLLRYAWQMNIPFIFTTHLHGLSQLVEDGKYPGVRNMQAEIVEREGGVLELTHRLIPGRALQSYGTRVSAEVGVTQAALDNLLKQRIARGEINNSRLRS